MTTAEQECEALATVAWKWLSCHQGHTDTCDRLAVHLGFASWHEMWQDPEFEKIARIRGLHSALTRRVGSMESPFRRRVMVTLARENIPVTASPEGRRR